MTTHKSIAILSLSYSSLTEPELETIPLALWQFAVSVNCKEAYLNFKHAREDEAIARVHALTAIEATFPARQRSYGLILS